MNLLSNIQKSISEGVSLPNLEVDFTDISSQLSDGLYGLLDTTFAERKSDINNSKLGINDIENTINKYTKQNIIIAASSAMIPGPAGIFTAIPEVLLTMGNQMKMIYDLSCSFDKEELINKDLLLEIPIMAFGGNVDLASKQFDVNLEDSSADILQAKAMELGSAMIKKSVKGSLVKMIPIAGPIVMANWAKMTSRKISTSSTTFLDNGKELVQEKIQEIEEDPRIIIEKIKCLILLIESDGRISQEQLNFIKPIIESTDLSELDKMRFCEAAAKKGSRFDVDYHLLSSDKESLENLMLDLCTLAKRDGDVHIKEHFLIDKLANRVGYSRQIIDDLLY